MEQDKISITFVIKGQPNTIEVILDDGTPFHKAWSELINYIPREMFPKLIEELRILEEKPEKQDESK